MSGHIPFSYYVQRKCEQYWPEKVGQTLDPHNGLVVTLVSHIPFSDFIIRNFKLYKVGCSGKLSICLSLSHYYCAFTLQILMIHTNTCTHTYTQLADKWSSTLDINHFHFTAWPDHGVPQFATSFISFIRRVQKSHKKDLEIPLLVHCSAGVGRTGTFIMLDTIMDRLRSEDSINVHNLLFALREQRMHLVQTQVYASLDGIQTPPTSECKGTWVLKAIISIHYKPANPVHTCV